MKKIFLLVLAIAMFQFSNAQTQVGEVQLPNSVNYNSATLKLNGTGIRKKAVVLKLYSAGLYLENKSSSSKTILSSDDNISMKLVITSGFVSSEAMSEAVLEGFEASMNGNTKPLDSEIKKFITFFKDPIVEGDTFDITSQKGKGVVAYKNGKELGTIAGANFKKAVFGIWLGDNPVDSKLKKGLLGN